jgi:hypothetical protein
MLKEVIGYFRNLPHRRRIARKLVLYKIDFHNSQIVKGIIMSVQFSKSQKVTATLNPLDQNGNPLPDSSVSGFTATVADTTIATVTNINAAALSVDILGAGDGTTTVTYSGTNANGQPVTLTDTIVIAEQLVATSLQVSYSAPVSQ